MSFVGTKKGCRNEVSFLLNGIPVFSAHGRALAAELAAKPKLTKYAAGLLQNLYFSARLAAGRLVYVGTGIARWPRLQQKLKLGINISILVPTSREK